MKLFLARLFFQKTVKLRTGVTVTGLITFQREAREDRPSSYCRAHRNGLAPFSMEKMWATPIPFGWHFDLPGAPATIWSVWKLHSQTISGSLPKDIFDERHKIHHEATTKVFVAALVDVLLVTNIGIFWLSFKIHFSTWYLRLVWGRFWIKCCSVEKIVWWVLSSKFCVLIKSNYVGFHETSVLFTIHHHQLAHLVLLNLWAADPLVLDTLVLHEWLLTWANEPVNVWILRCVINFLKDIFYHSNGWALFLSGIISMLV